VENSPEEGRTSARPCDGIGIGRGRLGVFLVEPAGQAREAFLAQQLLDGGDA